WTHAARSVSSCLTRKSSRSSSKRLSRLGVFGHCENWRWGRREVSGAKAGNGSGNANPDRRAASHRDHGEKGGAKSGFASRRRSTRRRDRARNRNEGGQESSEEGGERCHQNIAEHLITACLLE